MLLMYPRQNAKAAHAVRYAAASLPTILPVLRTAHTAGENAMHSVRCARAERSAFCSMRQRWSADNAALTRCILFEMLALSAGHSVRHAGAGLLTTLQVLRTLHSAGANAMHSVQCAGAGLLRSSSSSPRGILFN